MGHLRHKGDGDEDDFELDENDREMGVVRGVRARKCRLSHSLTFSPECQLYHLYHKQSTRNSILECTRKCYEKLNRARTQVHCRTSSRSLYERVEIETERELVRAKKIVAKKILHLMDEKNLEPVYIATFQSDVFSTIRFTKEEEFDFDVSHIEDPEQQAEERKKKRGRMATP